MHPLKIRVEFVKSQIGTYTLRIFHDFESKEFHGYTKKDIESLTANDIAAKIITVATFKNIIESDMGFYLENKWMRVTSFISPYKSELEIYPNDKCYICGTFAGWQGNPLKFYKGKPHCLMCRMADERKGNNVRP